MAFDWLAVWHGWQRVNYLTKPAAVAFLLAWLWSVSHLSGNLLGFGAGLFFSLLGDIFLLLTYRYFIYGLAAFLLAHIAYVVAFNPTPPPVSIASFVIALLLISIWSLVYAVIRRGLAQKSAYHRMFIPVGVYSAVITLMFFSALMTFFRTDWLPLSASLVACGAGLFFCSDIMLALDRFVQPFPHARLWVRITYHLGQLALIAGALLNFIH